MNCFFFYSQIGTNIQVDLCSDISSWIHWAASSPFFLLNQSQARTMLKLEYFHFFFSLFLQLNVVSELTQRLLKTKSCEKIREWIPVRFKQRGNLISILLFRYLHPSVTKTIRKPDYTTCNIHAQRAFSFAFFIWF